MNSKGRHQPDDVKASGTDLVLHLVRLDVGQSGMVNICEREVDEVLELVALDPSVRVLHSFGNA